MNAKKSSLEQRHASLGIWFVLAIGIMTGSLIGAAGLILGFAGLLALKTQFVG